MSFAGGGSADVIRRPAFANSYRDANASPKPLNSAVMSYRDPNERGCQDYSKLGCSKSLPLKSANYYSKIIDKAKCQQNSARGQYLAEEDDRVHNDLLEEIFNVQDSINLDYFELERQAIDPYPVEFNSGLTRLSADFEQNDQVIHFGALDAEEEGYKLLELQSRQMRSDHVGGPVFQGSRKTVGCDKPGPEIIAVASPTISSTCETMTGNCGTVKSQPDSTSSSVGVDYTVSYVDSTTNLTQSIQPGTGSDDLPSAVAKTSCEMQLVASATESRQNIRPRMERITRSGVTVGSNANMASSEVANPTCKAQAIASASGESTAASSTSTSPSQLHATKKQRTIECGNDLLADVRDSYEFVRGANLFAPSFHPTFSSFSVDTKTAVFQGHQQQVSQNDKDSAVSLVTTNVGDRNATPSRPSANTAWDARVIASPGHVHMSCPDLASPIPQSPSLLSSAEGPSMNDVALSGYHGQRPGALQGFYQQPAYESMTSLSAPCTPSKRSVPHFQSREQFVRSPAVQYANQHMANITGNRAAGQGMSQFIMKPTHQGSSGNVSDSINRQQDLQTSSINTLQRVPSLCQTPQFRNNSRQFMQQNVVNQNNLPQDLIAGQNPSSSYPYGTQVSECMPPQQPAGSLQRSVTGAPLSQNAFLRGLINDKSSAFRSHRLFPLLRDIIIADMNFHTPSFPFQLICNLPSDFNHLIQNYVSRNPHLANVSGGDATIESVFMDALAYAHATLIGKIKVRKMNEGVSQRSGSYGIEDFCETFERTVNPVLNEYPDSANINQYESYSTYSDAPRLSRPITPTVCQQPGFTAPSTPRGSVLQNQNYSAPSTPSSCLARQQNLMATMSQASDVNRNSDVYLPSSVPNSGVVHNTNQKAAGYNFTPVSVGNAARQQDVVVSLSNYDYMDRCPGIVTPSRPMTPRSDIVTSLPPSGAMMNVNLKLEGSGPMVSSRPMGHSQEFSAAFMGSDSLNRHQDQMAPLTTPGSMGYHNDYMPPFVSSASTGRHQDMMDPVNPSALNMRNQQLIHPPNRNQMADSVFLTRSSSGRCLSRGDDIHYEHSGLDLDLPYHDNALLSRRQNNERLVHSLPTSPRKIMQPSVHGNVMSPLFIGNNTIGSYSNSDYNLEKTNKSKVLPKEAVAIMTEWLREHQDNPYPNDDEKEALILSTRLTINQINYWFTNARRRVLPKWALQRHLDEQEKSRRGKAETAS